MKAAIVPTILVVIVAIAGFMAWNGQKQRADALETRVAELEQAIQQTKGMESTLKGLTDKLNALPALDGMEDMTAQLKKDFDANLDSLKGLIGQNSAQFDSLKKEFSGLSDGISEQLKGSLDTLKQDITNDLMKKIQELIQKSLGGGKSTTPQLPIR